MRFNGEMESSEFPWRLNVLLTLLAISWLTLVGSAWAETIGKNTQAPQPSTKNGAQILKLS